MSKFHISSLLLLLFALVGTSAAAQLHLPLTRKDKDFKTHDPDEVADTLRNGSAEKRNELATELGIMAPDASNPAAKSDASCTSFNHVDQRQTHLRADADNSVIIADSGECDSTYLLVFDRGHKSEWRHVQTVRLASRAQRPEISFAELVQPGISEIIIHRETTRDSGAAEQENFVILKLLHDRLVPVLDTVERLEVTLPVRPENDGDNIQQSEQSTFSMVKAAPNAGAATHILEKEVLKEKKATITFYRSWNWDPDLERFRSSAGDGSDVVQWQAPKKVPAKQAATTSAHAPAAPPQK
jgi:hypothetical protein